MKKSFISFFLCIVWMVSTSHAEPLSLRQALVFGIAENYDLRIARLDVERAEAGVLGEKGSFDLIAELGVNTSHSEVPADSVLLDDVVGTKQAQAEAALSKQFATGLQTRLSLTGTRSDADSLADRLDPAYRTALVLDLTQPLLKDMGLDINTANLKIARTRQQQVAYGYLDNALQLASEIENSYLDLAQAEEGYRYTILARDLAKELLDGNQRKFDAGLIPITEVNEARTAVAGRKEALLLSKQQIVQLRNQLLDLIDHGHSDLPEGWQVGLPEITAQTEVDLNKALELGLKNRPDLQQPRLELDTRKVALVYADNQKLPRLDLEASLGVNGLSGDADSDAYHNGGWQDSFADDGHTWYAGLRFSLPLQNRVAKAQYRDAEAQNKQSLLRLRRAEVAVEAAIRTAHATTELGLERVAVARQSAELAQTTLSQENRRLDEGLSDTFRILIFQNALIAAKVSEVAAIADFCRAQASLYRAMGTNLERYNIVAALPHQGAMP